MKRLLVIHTAYPGDLLLATPLLEALKTAGAEIHLSLLTVPGNTVLFENNPFLDEIIVYDKKAVDRGVVAFLRLARDIRRRKFDAALIPHPSVRSALLALCGGIKRRTGFAHRWCSFLYTEPIPVADAGHEVERNLALARPYVALDGAPGPKVFPSGKDKARALAFLVRIGPDSPFVAVAPGSTWKTKAWPEEKYAELLRSLRKEYPVVLVGGAADRDLCERLASSTGFLDSRACPRPRSGVRGSDGLAPVAAGDGAGHPVASAAGELTLLESAALLSRALFLISGDSAPVHLASAVGTPVVVIYGPTVKEFGFFPYGVASRIVERPGLACRPCSAHGPMECPLGHFRCMREIGVEEALSAASDLMRDARAAASGKAFTGEGAAEAERMERGERGNGKT